MEKSKIKAGERANVGQPIFRPLGKTKTATELPSQREKKKTQKCMQNEFNAGREITATTTDRQAAPQQKLLC